MRVTWRSALLLAGLAALAGAVLHVLIAIGGPAWYEFFGAPTGLVRMAQHGNLRAPVSALVIAAVLLAWSLYAFSGVGLIRRLPGLRVVLALIAAVLLLRGALFIPLVAFAPGALSRVCACSTVDAFIVTTSILCLAMGAGYAIGAWKVD